MSRSWTNRAAAEALYVAWQVRPSGETQERFCRGRGVSVWTFRRWRLRLEREGLTGGPLTEGTAPRDAAPAHRFVEVTPTSLSSRCSGDEFCAEILTVHGNTIRVRASIDEALLRRLVAAC